MLLNCTPATTYSSTAVVAASFFIVAGDLRRHGSGRRRWEVRPSRALVVGRDQRGSPWGHGPTSDLLRLVFADWGSGRHGEVEPVRRGQAGVERRGGRAETSLDPPAVVEKRPFVEWFFNDTSTKGRGSLLPCTPHRIRPGVHAIRRGIHRSRPTRGPPWRGDGVAAGS